MQPLAKAALQRLQSTRVLGRQRSRAARHEHIRQIQREVQLPQTELRSSCELRHPTYLDAPTCAATRRHDTPHDTGTSSSSSRTAHASPRSSRGSAHPHTPHHAPRPRYPTAPRHTTPAACPASQRLARPSQGTQRAAPARQTHGCASRRHGAPAAAPALRRGLPRDVSAFFVRVARPFSASAVCGLGPAH
mgnify:CR=1 FL=1